MERDERKRRRCMEAGPEGETELPETRVVSDGVAGINVDLNGESHHEREQIKKKNPEVKVACQEEKAKKSKARREKLIRVESEETQDYVREAKDTGQEETEGLSFVPSAISAPRKPMFLSDNQCSEKTLSFWQLASVVIQEGEESCTTNLCEKCCGDSLKAKWEKH